MASNIEKTVNLLLTKSPKAENDWRIWYSTILSSNLTTHPFLILRVISKLKIRIFKKRKTNVLCCGYSFLLSLKDGNVP